MGIWNTTLIQISKTVVFAVFLALSPSISHAQSVDVWVNSKSKVCHCPGARWYGKTKKGFMLDEVEAVDNGYRPANNKRCSTAGQEAVTKTAGSVAGNIKVWVNKKSHVYHCPGARWHGKTKKGTFMLESEAISSGNRPSGGGRMRISQYMAIMRIVLTSCGVAADTLTGKVVKVHDGNYTVVTMTEPKRIIFNSKASLIAV